MASSRLVGKIFVQAALLKTEWEVEPRGKRETFEKSEHLGRKWASARRSWKPIAGTREPGSSGEAFRGSFKGIEGTRLSKAGEKGSANANG